MGKWGDGEMERIESCTFDRNLVFKVKASQRSKGKWKLNLIILIINYNN
ncbi:MAG: hypothetical protein F6K65_15925 [Moorea sp. SIO3C2]|nr:hypothetical protein [Moorena sp. SIO3C2]